MTEKKETVKKAEIVPLKVERENETYTIEDKNGFKWEYQFQFPGLRQAARINELARAVRRGDALADDLYDVFFKQIIVEPYEFSIEQFEEEGRPGFAELMAAADRFLAKEFLGV